MHPPSLSGSDPEFPESSESVPLPPPPPLDPTPTTLRQSDAAPRPPPLRPGPFAAARRAVGDGHRHHGAGGAHGDASPSIDPRPPLFLPRYAAAAAGRGRGANGSSLRPRVRDDDRRATTHGRAAVATTNESRPLPHPTYHSSPSVVYPNPMQQPQAQPFASHRRGHGSSPGSGRGHHQSRSPPLPVRQHLVPPFSVHPRRSPPQQPPIPPGMLILDMRYYTSIEDAIFQVTSYLQNIRQLAMERGLVGREEAGGWDPDGLRAQLFVTIVAGSGSAGAFLRTILQEVLQNCKIRFIDQGGESFHIDALSGMMGAADGEVEEMPSVRTLGAVEPAESAARPFPPESGGAVINSEEEDEVAATNSSHEVAPPRLSAPQDRRPLDCPPPTAGHDRKNSRSEGELRTALCHEQQCSLSSRTEFCHDHSLMGSPNVTQRPPPAKMPAQLSQEPPPNEVNPGGNLLDETPLSLRHQELIKMQDEIMQTASSSGAQKQPGGLLGTHSSPAARLESSQCPRPDIRLEPPLSSHHQELTRVQAGLLQNGSSNTAGIHLGPDASQSLDKGDSSSHQELMRMQAELLQGQSGSYPFSSLHFDSSTRHQSAHNESSLPLRHKEQTTRQVPHTIGSISGSHTPRRSPLTVTGCQDTNDGEPPLSPRRQELMRIYMRIKDELLQHGNVPSSEELQSEISVEAAVNTSEEGDLTDDLTPQPSQHHQEFARMQAQLLQQHSYSLPSDQQHAGHHQDPHNVYPQDHGSGIQYNPYISIAQALRTRAPSRGSSVGSSNPGSHHSGSPQSNHQCFTDPELMVPDGDRIADNTGTNRRSEELPAVARVGDDASGYPTDAELPVLSPDGIAHGTLLAPIRSPRESDSVSDVTSLSNLNHPSANPFLLKPEQQQHPSRRNDDCLDNELRKAIAESQAAHIADTKQLVKQDIRLRRALELASKESASADCQAGADVIDSQGVVLRSPTEEDKILVQIIRQSILDERKRKVEAEKKYALMLEHALKQSEELAMHQQKQEEHLKRSEDELVLGMVAKSCAEVEAERQKEEELLRYAVTQSLESGAKDEKERKREEEQLKIALTQSLAENAAEMEKLRLSEQEQIRWAMTQSLVREVKVSGDELVEEGMRKSLNNGKDPELELEQITKPSLDKKECIGKEGGEQRKKPAESKSELDYDEDDLLKSQYGHYSERGCAAPDPST